MKTRNRRNRSSRPEVFCEKGFLRNFAKFTGKHLCQNLFFNKVPPASLLKKRLWHRYFSVNLANFLRTPFSTEHLWWLLLVKLCPLLNYFPFFFTFSKSCCCDKVNKATVSITSISQKVSSSKQLQWSSDLEGPGCVTMPPLKNVFIKNICLHGLLIFRFCCNKNIESLFEPAG